MMPAKAYFGLSGRMADCRRAGFVCAWARATRRVGSGLSGSSCAGQRLRNEIALADVSRLRVVRVWVLVHSGNEVFSNTGSYENWGPDPARHIASALLAWSGWKAIPAVNYRFDAARALSSASASGEITTNACCLLPRLGWMAMDCLFAPRWAGFVSCRKLRMPFFAEMSICAPGGSLVTMTLTDSRSPGPRTTGWTPADVAVGPLAVSSHACEQSVT